ncbi:MAG: NAD(P)-dependent oxidoreductase [Planctomycetota bacterium]|jgi:3-hydroxyisobutyrate dehydrogenase-like beta-hydroxyacid dehydrogenase|nr:NAD(P)-dependent oxidoreductase [Planctomycetota bacterium]MDP7133005.1 NAD(P)-dependent oxidoreductase [Planctomycetota bacterium]MDP7249873.1 NAD(P)-dependent oxidoreductase [Planctomycetota bacterium]
MEPIGIIGLGLLGSALAERLATRGFDLLGFDINPAQLESASALGCRAAESAAAVCEACNTILLSLPTSQVAADVMDEITPCLRAGQTILDTTTGDPQEMASLETNLADHAVNYVEANIAGSSGQARRGEVTLFLGGDEAVIRTHEELFSSMAAHVFHLGGPGTASSFKLVHNLAVGLHRAVLAETLLFGNALGFDPDQTLSILKQTPASSAAMEIKGHKMVSADYTPQARLSQHLKDVRLMIAEAHRVGVAIPLTQLHQQLLLRAEELGFGDSDNSAIIEAIRSPQ